MNERNKAFIEEFLLSNCKSLDKMITFNPPSGSDSVKFPSLSCSKEDFIPVAQKLLKFSACNHKSVYRRKKEQNCKTLARLKKQIQNWKKKKKEESKNLQSSESEVKKTKGGRIAEKMMQNKMKCIMKSEPKKSEDKLNTLLNEVHSDKCFNNIKYNKVKVVSQSENSRKPNRCKSEKENKQNKNSIKEHFKTIKDKSFKTPNKIPVNSTNFDSTLPVKKRKLVSDECPRNHFKKPRVDVTQLDIASNNNNGTMTEPITNRIVPLVSKEILLSHISTDHTLSDLEVYNERGKTENEISTTTLNSDLNECVNNERDEIVNANSITVGPDSTDDIVEELTFIEHSPKIGSVDDVNGSPGRSELQDKAAINSSDELSKIFDLVVASDSEKTTEDLIAIRESIRGCVSLVNKSDLDATKRIIVENLELVECKVDAAIIKRKNQEIEKEKQRLCQRISNLKRFKSIKSEPKDCESAESSVECLDQCEIQSSTVCIPSRSPLGSEKIQTANGLMSVEQIIDRMSVNTESVHNEVIDASNISMKDFFELRQNCLEKFNVQSVVSNKTPEFCRRPQLCYSEIRTNECKG